MDRKAELVRQINALMEEKNAIDDEEDRIQNAALHGQCFKVMDCYSCPETDADYWWLYIKVTNTDDGLKCLKFSVDCNGCVMVDPDAYFGRGTLDRYTSITGMELSEAWDSMLKQISKIEPKEEK